MDAQYLEWARWIGGFALIYLALFLYNRARKAWAERITTGRDSWLVSREMPPELKKGQLLFENRFVRRGSPCPMEGTLPRVYRVRKNQLVLLGREQRAHAALYERDRVKLSCQFYLLLDCRQPEILTTDEAPDYAYIELVTPEGSWFQKVQLLTTGQIQKRWNDYFRVVEGNEKPKPTQESRICRCCHHRLSCPDSLWKD